jgi:hypothetical protein
MTNQSFSVIAYIDFKLKEILVGNHEQLYTTMATLIMDQYIITGTIVGSNYTY